MSNSKKKILLIDDDYKRFKIVQDALFMDANDNEEESIFSEDKYEIFPKEDEAKDFCYFISSNENIDIYFKIFQYIEENNIDILFTDLTFNPGNNIGNSSGEFLIEKLLSDNLHSKLPIIAYSRKSNKQIELKADIRAKITYIPVGAEINDASEIKRKILTEIKNVELIEDKIKEYKNSKYGFDLAIICALNKEYEAVKKLSEEKWTPVEQNYEISYWKNNESQRILKVALTSMDNNMGMVEATLRTLDLINLTKPKLVAMTGIAGGSKINGARLGDVCVAKTVDNWQSGKYKSGGRIELSPEIRGIDQDIKEIIEKHIRFKRHKKIIEEIIEKFDKNTIEKLIRAEIKADKKYLKEIEDENEKEKFEKTIRNKDRLPEFKFMDMMTGSSLVTDEKIISKEMLNRNRKAFFFDMEGYAVARTSHTKNIKWIVIKSIVDYGDHQKGDNWHKFLYGMFPEKPDMFLSLRLLQF